MMTESENRIFFEIEVMMNNDINSKVIDSYINNFPYLDYLIGLKAYLILSENSYIEAKNFLNIYKDKHDKFEYGTFSIMCKGLIYLYEKKRKKAEEYMYRSYNIDTLGINRYIRLELSNYYFYTNRKKSMELLDEALSIDKNYVDAKITKANILLMDGSYFKGKQMLKKLKKNSTNVFINYHLSIMYFNQGKIKKAKRYLLEALEIKIFPEAYCGLGFFYEINGDRITSLEYYLKAYSLNPLNIEANTKLAWFYSNTDIKKAKQYFETVYKLSDNPDAILNLIYAQLATEDYKFAKETYDEYISIYGQDYNIEYFNILFLILTKNIKKAQESYNRYTKIFTSSEVNWLKEGLKSWNVSFEYLPPMPRE